MYVKLLTIIYVNCTGPFCLPKQHVHGCILCFIHSMYKVHVSMLLVHAACLCRIPMLHVHVACPCFMSVSPMLHAHAPCPCLHAACPCSMSVSPCCIKLHAHAPCPCLHAACPCLQCLRILVELVLIACLCLMHL